MQLNQSYSIETIQKVCSEVECSNLPQNLVARMYNIPESTVSNWCRAYRLNGNQVPPRKKHVGKPPKLTPEDADRLKSWLDEEPQLTCRALRAKLIEETGKTVSEETIRKCTIGFHYTLKRVYRTAVNADFPNTKQLRKDFARWFEDHAIGDGVRKLLFIDETGFKIEMRTNYGRSKKGEIIRIRTPRLRSRNHSAICALGYEDVPHYKLLEGSGNTVNMLLFLDELFDKLPSVGYTLIMDNVRFHRAKPVQELIRQRGHFLKYLPPYSPYLDGIEYFFNQWKGIVRNKKPNDEVELLTAIAQIDHLVTPETCRSYFLHIQHNCQKIIAGEENIN